MNVVLPVTMVESNSNFAKNAKFQRGGTQTTMPSSHSLNSRRRRHKTVHFGETLMSEVRCGDERTSSQEAGGCESRGSVTSLPGQFDYNVQQLFTFIGTVLSAWDKDETSSEPCSRPPSQSSRCRKRRPNVLNYLLNGQSSMEGDEHLCSPTFKHKHCRLPAGSCNALFLRKVRRFTFAAYIFVTVIIITKLLK